MKQKKQKKLEKAGLKVATVKEFLKLSDAELSLIEFKRVLIQKIKEIRKLNNITQESLAKLVESSQSRIAKLEAGDTGISLDLICRVLFSLGINEKDIAKTLLKK